MPIPILLGAAVFAAGYGVKKGYDGYQKHSEADEVIKDAKERYAAQEKIFSVQEESTTAALNALAEDELHIEKQIEEFKNLAEQLKKKLSHRRIDKFLNIFVRPKRHTLQGKRPRTLSVKGATVHTLINSGLLANPSWIGSVLSFAMSGPGLALAGWIYNNRGDEALSNAYKIDEEVDLAVSKLEQAQAQLEKIEKYTLSVSDVLNDVYTQFEGYLQHLKYMDDLIEEIRYREKDVKLELAKVSDSVMRSINNGFALAAILVEIITTPLFKVKEVDGRVVMDEDGVPALDTDEDGLVVVNAAELQRQMDLSKARAAEVEFV